MADHDERSPLLGSSDEIEPNQRIDDDQEIQRSRSRDSPQYEGLPEVKKKLRWIVPAVAIGVSFFLFFFFFFLHGPAFDKYLDPLFLLTCIDLIIYLYYYRYSSQLQI